MQMRESVTHYNGWTEYVSIENSVFCLEVMSGAGCVCRNTGEAFAVIAIDRAKTWLF